MTNQNVTDTVLQQPVDITIKVNKQNLLHKLKILPKSKTFKVSPILMGTLLRISKIVDTIDSIDPNSQKQLFHLSLDLIATNTDKLIEVLALAITNTKAIPKSSLKDFLFWNLTADEMYNLLQIILGKMDVMPFTNSIILIRGVSLTNPSPTEAQEARGELSEEQLSTSALQ